MKKYFVSLLLLLTAFGAFGQTADLNYSGFDKLETQLKYDLNFPVLHQTSKSLYVAFSLSGVTSVSYTLQDPKRPDTLFQGSFTGSSYVGVFQDVPSWELNNKQLKLTLYNNTPAADTGLYLESYRVGYNSPIIPEPSSVAFLLVGGLIFLPLCKRK